MLRLIPPRYCDAVDMLANEVNTIYCIRRIVVNQFCGRVLVAWLFPIEARVVAPQKCRAK